MVETTTCLVIHGQEGEGKKFMEEVSEVKAEGQVFTPNGIVSMILDAVKYFGDAILTKSVMEPSFGDGAFLVEIVSRIIHRGMDNGLNASDIHNIIENNVYGIEKDHALYKKAILRLDDLLHAYNIPDVEWKHLFCDDTLTAYKTFVGKMDWVVGIILSLNKASKQSSPAGVDYQAA